MCSVCRMDPERTEAFASALEYFHLASLVLDDLPCMDDAESRRGMPCTHLVYGDAMAILSSLALINRSYFLIWEGLNGLSAEVQREVNALLDQCLGLNGILNGQAMDLKFINSDKSASTVERIAILKTGSLLKLSILLPWIACSGSKTTRNILRRLAERWGRVYQLLDDFKDIEWGERVSGKTPLRDAVLNHPNLAVTLGKEGAIERLREHIQETRRLMDSLEGHEDLIKALQPFQAKLELAGEAFLAQSAA